jgi:hypothetical protein
VHDDGDRLIHKCRACLVTLLPGICDAIAISRLIIRQATSLGTLLTSPIRWTQAARLRNQELNWQLYSAPYNRSNPHNNPHNKRGIWSQRTRHAMRSSTMLRRKTMSRTWCAHSECASPQIGSDCICHLKRVPCLPTPACCRCQKSLKQKSIVPTSGWCCMTAAALHAATSFVA